MSQSFFKYETQEEILERIKRLRVQMLKNRLREARHNMENQRNELKSNPGKASDNKGRDYSISGSLNSDVLNEGIIRNDGEGDSPDNMNTDFDSHIPSGSSFIVDGAKRERFDLSSYLAADREFQGEGDRRLRDALARIDDRIPDSDRARADYVRLMKSIEEITGDSDLDIEQKISMVEGRVTLYIENSNYDNSALDEDLLLDYKALCILLGVDEQVLSVEELRPAVDSLMEEYRKKSDKEIVAEMVNDALVNLGMKVDGCCVLDGQVDGELYSSDEGSTCKVFVSCNDSGIMIEPVNADRNAPVDEVVTAQKKVCAAERKLMEEAEKSGIILKKIYSKEHTPEEMATEMDLEYDKDYTGQTAYGQHNVEEAGDSSFERMRSYNRMRRERRKVKAREMRYE